MKKICKNCKYWNIPDGGTTYGDCGLINLKRKDGNEDPEESWKTKPGLKAYAQDGSDYFAAVICEHDFGCVLWKAKEVTL